MRWPFKNPKTIPAENPEDLQSHVQHAYVLLYNANRRGIQVPSEVVSTITQARIATKDGTLEGELETRFWNAYGLLSSSIEPAEWARRTYKIIFYCVLVTLLLGQFFYLGGASVRDKMMDIDKQIIEVRGRAADAEEKNAAANLSARAEVERQVIELHQRQKAYFILAKSILGGAAMIADLPLRPFGVHGLLYTEDSTGDELESTIIRGKLEMMLVFFSGYLLPMLYGLLGACAFVLRKLSDEIDKMTYAHDARVRYTLRLNIGLLAGLAVGWFLKPGGPDPSLTSLSPLALAFVAGYGSDLFFVLLDNLVNAFAPAGSAATTTKTETTTGGIITVKTSEVAAHVAGDALSEDAARAKAAETAANQSTVHALDITKKQTG